MTQALTDAQAKELAVYRPSFTGNQILLMHDLVLVALNSCIHSTEDREALVKAFKTLGKVKVSVDLGLAGDYIKQIPENKVRKSISINALGGTSPRVKGELTDKEKLAAMSPEEEEKFWADQMNAITQVDITKPEQEE